MEVLESGERKQQILQPVQKGIFKSSHKSPGHKKCDTLNTILYLVANLHRVHTKHFNQFSRTFQGLFKDQTEFLRTTYQE